MAARRKVTKRQARKTANPWPFSHPDARRTTPAHGGIAHHQALAKERGATPKAKTPKAVTFKGRAIKPTAGGSWVIPSVDRESEFDTVQDAKDFLKGWSRNPGQGKTLKERLDYLEADAKRILASAKKHTAEEVQWAKDMLAERKRNPASAEVAGTRNPAEQDYLRSRGWTETTQELKRMYGQGASFGLRKWQKPGQPPVNLKDALRIQRKEDGGTVKKNPFRSGLADAIRRMIDKKGGDYDRLGLRIDKRSLRIGSVAPASRVWVDGSPLRERLEGTSALEVTSGSVESVLQELEGYHYSLLGSRVSLIGSDFARQGEDAGERVFHKAKVLGTWVKGWVPNPNDKRNPAPASSEVFEDFHGFPPSEVVTVQKKVHHHAHLASLGTLVSLDVDGVDGRGHKIKGFKGALLACNEDRNQLFIEGGDQSLSLKEFGIRQTHEMETLGTVTDIGYHTNKTHLGDEGGEAVYVHKFRTTNDNGKHVTVRIARYPDLIYDVRNEQLLFSGGSYEILREGINK